MKPQLSSVTNNYIRVGKREFFFDDTNELDTRRVFKITEEMDWHRGMYKFPTIGWRSYMNGTRLILPCPEGFHEYIHSIVGNYCTRCGLMEQANDED